MALELDFQNPFGFTHLPPLSEFQFWADVALQKSDSGNDDDLNSDYSVVIRVTNEAESKSLNHDYRQKNTPTNVLSFPFEMPDLPEMLASSEMKENMQPHHLGDLVFCEPLVEKEALEQDKTLTQHWAHLVLHGMLHLQGFDHINDNDAEIMETLEIKIMQQLNFPNPYE